MMAAIDPVTGKQPSIDEKAVQLLLLQQAVTEFIESAKTEFKNFVRKTVEEVLKERDDAFIEKLEQINQQAKEVSKNPIREYYESIYSELTDGWVQWSPIDEHDNPDLPLGTKVYAKFADGYIMNEPCVWDIFMWNHDLGDANIIAYKVAS